MDGPRAVASSELLSLGELVDTVFRSGGTGEMFRLFPTFLVEDNAHNLLVFRDDSRIVSHVGMALHWACIEGCTVGVACIGAVATYESHRGQGMASQLMDFACRQAQEWGADFMMISGGRGLYRRLGAADVGHDYEVEIDAAAATALQDGTFTLTSFHTNDLTACAALYATRAAHYLRPVDDWEAFTRAKVCMCNDVDIWVVRRGETICGYCATDYDTAKSQVRVFEFAGDAVAIAAALKPLINHYEAAAVGLHLEPGDRTLHELLTQAGVGGAPAITSGTMLLLDVPRLIDRFQPLFQARLGRTATERLAVEAEDGGAYRFTLGSASWTAPGKMEAAQFLFGHPEFPQRPAPFDAALPISTLWYGFDYV